MQATISILPAAIPAEIETARTLLHEYANYLNDSVGEQHICLTSYEEELAALPGVYAEPQGALLLAYVDGEPAGCVALKPLKTNRAVAPNEAACEMKRLWVRPQFRGLKLGQRLAEALIERAIRLGYTAMYLDTMPATMQAANRMYQLLGFEPVERYNENPVLGANPTVDVVFFRRSLV